MITAIEKKSSYIWVEIEGKLISEEDGLKISNRIVSELNSSFPNVVIDLSSLNYINSSSDIRGQLSFA